MICASRLNICRIVSLATPDDSTWGILNHDLQERSEQKDAAELASAVSHMASQSRQPADLGR
jgi:hypothetical protein